ncbi:MAG: chemotaxis protein CheA [Acidobacteria bacterium]|nr:chemotaxis protein CheA [Acidobacteriota bacterium]
MQQVKRETILALNQTRNQLSSLDPENKEIIIHAGAGLETALEEIPAEFEDVSQTLILCLQALQAIYQDQAADFETALKAILGALIASEQSLGAPPNPISELMLKQARTTLQKELDRGAADETLADEPPAFEVRLESLDDVSSFLIQLELSDKKGLESVCEALKTISVDEPDKEKRKLIVKAARELTKIVTGKAPDADAAFGSVSELIDQANGQMPIAAAPAAVPEPAPEPKIAAPAETPVKAVAPVPEVAPLKAVPPPKPVEAEVPEVYEPDILPVDADASLVSEFVIESYELMEAAESALLALETEPENVENVNTVFRAFHTVKGSAAYLGFKRMTELAHHAESLLSRIRDREIRCAGGYATLALRSLDTLKAMLNAVEGCAVGGAMHLPGSFAELIGVLKNPESHGVNDDNEIFTAPAPQADQTEAAADSFSMDEILEEVLPAVIAGKSDFARSSLLNTGDPNEDVNKKSHSHDSSVRVRTDRLDRLIDMVGELVIAQSMLAQDATVVQGLHHDLSRKISHAGKIVRELQDLSMGMRMIPLKNTFQKMARLVRDVAKKCGKQVEFITEGEETEIDRNMVDLIADPLIHMVRNAVDHGIETPDKRQGAGKLVTGKVKLAAYHAGGDVVVELTDDGAGLDPEKIVAKAISKNLIESDKGMSENEIFRLIFAPGFSTAESVTDVSGRGVGMDVVRRNIEAMRGRIEISSEKGKGSIFTVRLPLTLAITDGMLVRVGSERYIVPTVNIQLSFQPNQKMLSSVTGRGELVSLRGELMPVFRLHQLFDVRDALEDPTEGLLMIVADGRRRCALLVDELLGQQQVVTKTLGQGIGKIPGVSGGAILGDGCVGLILDTAEIVALARQNTSAHERAERRDDSQKQAA